MATTKEILVCGATGNMGREVVAALQRAGRSVRVAHHHVERVRALWGDGVPAVPLDFTAPKTFAPAARGARQLFLLRPPAIGDVIHTLNPFLDVASAEGVEQVVFLSVMKTGRNDMAPHFKVERHLAELKVGWTFLRPGFFAQNFGDAYRQDIMEEDRVLVPAGGGRVAFVDLRDAAEVTAKIFTDPAAHRGQAYTLTGPEAVRFEQAAAWLSEAAGRPIRFDAASVPEYLRHLRRHKHRLGQALIETILHVGIRFGEAEIVDRTLARLLGRAPRTLRDYFRDHATLWQKAPT